MEPYLFYSSATVAVIASLAAITRRDAMHAILYLVVALIASALLFFLLGAPFVAALQIIVYAGAIIILFLFVVMMVNPPASSRGTLWRGWFGPLLLTSVLAVQWSFLLGSDTEMLAASPVGPTLLGQTLFKDYAFALQLVAIFLLVGLVGAYHIGRKDREPTPEGP